MSRPTFVRSFVSNTPEYHQVFAKFLAHTDQKRNAFDWILREVEKLPARSTMIDVGAGDGELTARLMPSFERVIAIEPNPSLAADLRAACPTAELISSRFMDAWFLPRRISSSAHTSSTTSLVSSGKSVFDG